MPITTQARSLLPSVFAGVWLAAFAPVPTHGLGAAQEPGKRHAGMPLQVPNRPATSRFMGRQGLQRTDIAFDPATGTVTMKLLVQDPHGYFIPNIRRENFVIYEDGIRQQNVSIDVDHAPVSVGLLLEYGGRYRNLSQTVGAAVTTAANRFLGELNRDDEVAIWRYGDKVEEVAGFSR